MISLFKDMSPRTEIILAVIAYSFCSGTLVLINKLILHFLPFPSLVITFQLWAALLFIFTAQFLNIITVDPIRWKFVLPYLAYTVAFSLGVYCNMRSLETSNVETVIVFRALAPCIVALLDAIFLGREFPSTRSWAALGTIFLGALGYASFDPKFKTQGMNAYLWPTAYLAAISFEMAYGKIIIRSVDLKTKSGPVLYTNLLGWPPMLVFAKLGGEYDRFWTEVWLKEGSKFPPASIALLLFGCVIGTGIGYSSWWCRDKVSATSFTLIGVMNKCVTVLLNLFIWDQHAPVGNGSRLRRCHTFALWPPVLLTCCFSEFVANGNCFLNALLGGRSLLQTISHAPSFKGRGEEKFDPQ
jgi:drug/metabolite transporter (DMT)-like permease